MKNYIDSYILEKQNYPLKRTILKFPKLNYGQVLVKIMYSGVCQSQLMEKKGLRGRDKWLPHLLGHEGSGIVSGLGKGVKKIKVGDKVILTWIKSKGINAKNAEYFTLKNTKINSGKVTTFSNYAVVSENRIVKKPKQMSLKHSPLFGCAIPTGAGIIFNQIKPSKKKIVIVIGLGGVGLSSILALKALKVEKILAIDKNKFKLKLAKKLGATHSINSADKNFKNEILNLCNKKGADYCVESAGLSSTIELGFSLIKKGGRLVFASHPDKSKKIKLIPHELISGKKIEGSWGGATKPDKDIPKFFKLFNKNKIKYNYLGNKIYNFSNLNKALKDLDNGKVFRPIIKMSHGN
tara:strand:- start:67 stop:1119 length:1053 start_codon:yes stop_codon:yes gene_type:complete